MELFLFRHAEFERLYNCTGLDIDAVPLEKRTQFMPESIAICLLCAIYYILYVPCMFSIWKHLAENSCYKLLFYIGIADLSILWILGFFSAWLNLRGAVYCSYPNLIYVVGIGVTALWVAESTADLILAFNRCIDLTSTHFSRILFAGRSTSFWMVGCSLYALYWAMFVKPGLYSSIIFGWSFFPFVGYRKDDHQYVSRLHIVHNVAVAFLSPAIYLFFAFKLFFNIQSNRQQQDGAVGIELSSVQKRTFLQVFLVSLINTLTGFLYMYFESFEVDQWVITLGEFAWLHVHGFPPVIYLALNKTIRTDCRMLYMKVFRKNRVSFIGGVTILRPTTGINQNTHASAVF